jgi:putative transposase
MAFIQANHRRFGVEPICRVLRIGPSAYWRHAVRRRGPSLCCARSIRDEALRVEIERVGKENFQVYGADKIWHQLRREGIAAARCTVERLMRRPGMAL